MGNIDCDQIILLGLVAMFSIYFYRNVLGQNKDGFSIGSQMDDLNAAMNANDVSTATNDAIIATENANNAAMTAINASKNANSIANDANNNANIAANAAKNAANNAINAANSANAANAAANSNNSDNANNSNNANDANDSNNIPLIFNTPEPDSNMGSVPQNYEVGSVSDSCLPQNVLSSSDLLPQVDKEAILEFLEEGDMKDGILKGVNFLNAGFHVGVNSVGQSLRNANRQIRSEPPNPQTQMSPWQNTTMAPDLQRRPLELTDSCAKSQKIDMTPEVPGTDTKAGDPI